MIKNIVCFLIFSLTLPIGLQACEKIRNNPQEPDYGITLYMTDWCPYCKKTIRLLNDLNVNYTHCNIESSSKGYRQYKSVGGDGVPLLIINGYRIEGYQPGRIKSAIEQIR